MDGPRAEDVLALLNDRLAIVSGGRDKRGGPLLLFPTSARRERVHAEDLKRLLHYLFSVPSEEARDRGFSVVIDMRGGTWTSVKPILKVLNEHFANFVYHVYVIKPDNFWQKQRTSLASHKYKYEMTMVGLDCLVKSIDSSQLTVDFDGSYNYDHKQWIESRIALENFLWVAGDLMDRLEDWREDITRGEFAEDVSAVKHSIEVHDEMQEKIMRAPFEDVDAMGQELLKRLSFDCSTNGSSYDSGYSGRSSSSNSGVSNPDLQASIPTVMQMVEQMHGAKDKLLQLWHGKKIKLDQCFQLRHFEQDCKKMLDWIQHSHEAFLTTYVEIGQSYQIAKRLKSDHEQFTINLMNGCVSINRILAMATHMVDTNHYASQHIRNLAGRINQAWKELTCALDERNTLLALSVSFHQKAEQYAEKIASWSQACDALNIPAEASVLETCIHQHQTIYESMCQAYTEPTAVLPNFEEAEHCLAKVHSTSKKLLYQLDHLVHVCNQPGMEILSQKTLVDEIGRPIRSTDPAADYSCGAKHVLDVIHEILARHRNLEQKWTSKKVKLHQKLALKLFKEDVKQVLDWLEKHGEQFLCKSVGIGRNLQKAYACQKSQDNFEKVVQNTYTNTEKLLMAADELARTGECNADEIYSVAQELDSVVRNFAARVQQRRRLVDAAVRFYTQEKQ